MTFSKTIFPANKKMTRKYAAAAVIAVNAVFILLALSISIREPVNEIRRLAAANALMEARLAIKRRNLEEMDGNRALLDAYERGTEGGAFELTPYSRLTDALEETNTAAARHELRVTAFEAYEPVVYETETAASVAEVRVFAAYEGEYGALCAFVKELSEKVYIGRIVFALNSGGLPSEARLEFSVYGVIYEE